MEDWKAVRDNVGDDDLSPVPSPEEKVEKARLSRQDSVEAVPQIPRKSSGRRVSLGGARLRTLSIDPENTGYDFEEEDAALKDLRETVHTLMEKECATDEVCH